MSTNEPTASSAADADEASAATEPAGSSASAATPGTTPEAARGEAVVRAEDLLDSIGQRLNSWVTTLDRSIRLVGARAREEAEDLLAEAQAIRAGNGHQQTTHARVMPTPHIERIDEEPRESDTTSDSTNAGRSASARGEDATAGHDSGSYDSGSSETTSSADELSTGPWTGPSSGASSYESASSGTAEAQ